MVTHSGLRMPCSKWSIVRPSSTNAGSSGTSANLNVDTSLLKGWIAGANNTGSASVTLVAVAVCGLRPALYEQVNGPSVDIGPGQHGSATATCPSGKVAIGGGARTGFDGTNPGNLNTTLPYPASAWQSYYNNTGGNLITVFPSVVCARRPVAP